MSKIISILDYSMGNITSVQRAVQRCGFECNIIHNGKEIREAEHLVLPGVGHFGKAMDFLRKNELDKALQEAVLEKKVPITGICLGMQLMCKGSEEGNTEGLAWFDCEVTRIHVQDSLRYKVPHTGWNLLEKNGEQERLKDLSPDDRFYFVHAYEVKTAPIDEVLSFSTYESRFVSSLIKNNIVGFQFHPEKSQDSGLKLL
ncbi:MAG: imidazole glycerol phosphate synthase subunit HisH [Bacteroidota bacterium]